MVSLARKNLLHDRLRFAITVAGVAFAVTLVLVQVGLFMGLLAKATVTIEHASADIWVTSKNTPNVDFAHTFPETAVLRVRGVPGVERADNLIVQFMNIQLPNGAEEGCLVYALEDFRAWNLPWNVQGADVRRPQARRQHPHGPLRGAALRPLRDRRLPRDPAPPLQDHRHHDGGRLLHHRAHRVHGLRERAGAQRDPAGPDLLRAGEDRAGRRRAGGGGGDPAAPPLQRRPHARRVGARSRGPTGWSPPASG